MKSDGGDGSVDITNCMGQGLFNYMNIYVNVYLFANYDKDIGESKTKNQETTLLNYCLSVFEKLVTRKLTCVTSSCKAELKVVSMTLISCSNPIPRRYFAVS